MRSFGLWYKEGNDNDEKPVFSVHVNFWSESVKAEKNTPTLDIGIKIDRFRSVDEVVFHCPFSIDGSEVNDLIPKLFDIKNANIVFNIDGSMKVKESYSVYSFEKKSKKEDIILFPLKQSIDGIYSIKNNDGKTDLIFDFRTFNDFINKKGELTDIDEVYIRFRILSDKMKDSIYFDSKPYSRSFESAFSGTRIFDFKINETRNLGSKTIDQIAVAQYKFPKIEVIHLLVMEPSSYDVESFAEQHMTCRELEGSLWDDYFGEKISNSKGRILAYHWKFDNECSCLVKVKYSKTNIFTLATYFAMALAIGVFGSTIVSIIQAEYGRYFPGALLFISGALFAIGYFLSKEK